MTVNAAVCVCCKAQHRPTQIKPGDDCCLTCVENCTLSMEAFARGDAPRVFHDAPGDKIDRKYISIKFQSGPTGEAGENGCQIDDVLSLLIERLEGFQSGPAKCAENNMVIIKLMEARMWLEERTHDRVRRGVEGRSEA